MGWPLASNCPITPQWCAQVPILVTLSLCQHCISFGQVGKRPGAGLGALSSAYGHESQAEEPQGGGHPQGCVYGCQPATPHLAVVGRACMCVMEV